MRPARSLGTLVAAALLAALAGCGQKGPLTLPEQAEPSAVAPSGDTGETDETRDATEEDDG